MFILVKLIDKTFYWNLDLCVFRTIEFCLWVRIHKKQFFLPQFTSEYKQINICLVWIRFIIYKNNRISVEFDHFFKFDSFICNKSYLYELNIHSLVFKCKFNKQGTKFFVCVITHVEYLE